MRINQTLWPFAVLLISTVYAPPPADGLTVFLKFEGIGGGTAVDLASDATVGDLRAAAVLAGVQSTLSFQGKPLGDPSTTLADIGVGAEATVNVDPPPTVPVIVDCRHGKKIYQIRSSTVQEFAAVLRQQIKETESSAEDHDPGDIILRNYDHTKLRQKLRSLGVSVDLSDNDLADLMFPRGLYTRITTVPLCNIIFQTA